MKKFVSISVLIVVLFTIGSLIVDRTQKTSIEEEPVNYNKHIKRSAEEIVKKMPEEHITVVLNSKWREKALAKEIGEFTKSIQKITLENQNTVEENILNEVIQKEVLQNTQQEANGINNENNGQTNTETNHIRTETQYPYYIKVNCLANVVNIYTEDENGNHSVPYKAMLCSTRNCYTTIWSI